VRLEDPATTDVVQFIDPATGQATPKMIPLGRTLDYRIRISTTPFSATPQICPVAIVVTDGSNNLLDGHRRAPHAVPARLRWRFPEPAGRRTPGRRGALRQPAASRVATRPSTAGELGLRRDAARLGANGRQYWYSDATDRNLKFYADMTDSHTRAGYTNNQIWDGTDITWSGFGITFENSTAYINEIADQTAASPGLTNIAAGECIYVDYDRSTNHLRAGTPLVAHKATPVQHQLACQARRPYHHLLASHG